jgi:hypothetical protein
MVQGYDQSFSQAVSFADNAPQKLNAAAAEVFGLSGELETGGVRQIFEAGSNAKILARYPHGEAAIARIPIGKGAIYYSGSLLEERSYARLLEALFRDTGITRPVRIRRIAGGDDFAPLGSRKLLYVVNYNSSPARLGIDAAPGLFTKLLDLREQHEIRGAEVTVPAHQTAIYEMF